MPRTVPELNHYLALDPDIHPVSRRVVAAVERAIEEGLLTDCDKLPSSRRLADEYGIARSTVVEAYEILCGMGVAEAVHGSGTRIRAGAREQLGAGEPDPTRSRDRADRTVVDLTVPANVDLSALNMRDWNRAWREAISPLPEPRGVDELGEALQEHLRSFRGIVVGPTQIVLRPSFGSAIGDIVHGLELRGRGVAIEDPSYPRLQRHFLNEGCRTHCIPVDERGLRVDLLSPDVRAVHVTPARQWPTGVALQLDRRQELFDWSVRTGGVIIENDMDAEFTYGHAPLPTLFSTAPVGARVLYLGSPSKLITADLGVMWLVTDPGFRRRADDVAPVSDFAARALANYIASGALYRHRNRALALCAERRDALVTALRGVPEVSVYGEASGTDIIIGLPRQADEVRVQMQLEDLGYQVSTVGDFAIRRHPPALILHYADLTPTRARRFALALGQVLQQVVPVPNAS